MTWYCLIAFNSEKNIDFSFHMKLIIKYFQTIALSEFIELQKYFNCWPSK